MVSKILDLFQASDRVPPIALAVAQALAQAPLYTLPLGHGTPGAFSAIAVYFQRFSVVLASPLASQGFGTPTSANWRMGLNLVGITL